jgi:hypothetical protein
MGGRSVGRIHTRRCRNPSHERSSRGSPQSGHCGRGTFGDAQPYRLGGSWPSPVRSRRLRFSSSVAMIRWCHPSSQPPPVGPSAFRLTIAVRIVFAADRMSATQDRPRTRVASSRCLARSASHRSPSGYAPCSCAEGWWREVDAAAGVRVAGALGLNLPVRWREPFNRIRVSQAAWRLASAMYCTRSGAMRNHSRGPGPLPGRVSRRWSKRRCRARSSASVPGMTASTSS